MYEWNIDELISIINEIKGNDSLNELGRKTNTDPAYLSRIKNKLIKKPPVPKILEQLSAATINSDLYYIKMMVACGYLKRDLLLNFQISNQEVTQLKNKNITTEQKKELLYEYMDKLNIDSIDVIPLYSKINFSINSSQDNIEGYIPVNLDVYKLYNCNNYFYLKVNDNSMNLKFEKDSYILCVESNDVSDDDIVIISINKNEAIIRSYKKQNELIILEPCTSEKDKYKLQVLDTNKEKISIIGKVVGQFKQN